MKSAIRWAEEEKKYLRKIVKGRHYREIVKLMNKRFDREFTMDMISSAITRNKLNTGFNGHFKKGHVPHNKGKKGSYNKGSEKTWFKKGQAPVNHKPVGSERVDRDGYTFIKTEEPNKWELKHKVVWRQAYGEIPKGYCVIFADQNRTNFSLDNLILVSRSELLVMNKRKLIKDKAELTKVGVNIAKVQIKINELR